MSTTTGILGALVAFVPAVILGSIAGGVSNAAVDTAAQACGCEEETADKIGTVVGITVTIASASYLIQKAYDICSGNAASEATAVFE